MSFILTDYGFVRTAQASDKEVKEINVGISGTCSPPANRLARLFNTNYAAEARGETSQLVVPLFEIIKKDFGQM